MGYVRIHMTVGDDWPGALAMIELAKNRSTLIRGLLEREHDQALFAWRCLRVSRGGAEALALLEAMGGRLSDGLSEINTANSDELRYAERLVSTADALGITPAALGRWLLAREGGE